MGVYSAFLQNSNLPNDCFLTKLVYCIHCILVRHSVSPIIVLISGISQLRFQSPVEISECGKLSLKELYLVFIQSIYNFN